MRQPERWPDTFPGMRRSWIGTLVMVAALTTGCGASQSSSTSTTNVAPGPNDKIACNEFDGFLKASSTQQAYTSADVNRVLSELSQAENPNLPSEAQTFVSAQQAQDVPGTKAALTAILHTCDNMGVDQAFG